MTSDAEAPVKGRQKAAGRADSADLKTLGKYQIERKLGQGGMGAVYLARDTKLNRLVALKVLPRDKAENPTLVKRFRQEAESAARLKHEAIVAVYDADEADGYLYIAMEYVDGTDLYDLISKRGTIPVKRSIEMIKQVASALQHAHEHKIVHRDIKPSNLLIRRDGKVKLTDLGLARTVDDTVETNITRAGTTVGTVDYMAPEQARSSKLADIRSDIYSLGCTWYHMLTGSVPYPEGSMTNKLQAHAVKPPPDPRAINDQVADGLVAVLHRMMAKKPEDRYQTPAELLADLDRAIMTKGAVSQEIFHAIEEESGVLPSSAATTGGTSAPARGRTAAAAATETAGTETTGSASGGKAPAKGRGGTATMPPKRLATTGEQPEQQAPNREWIKYAAASVAGVAVIGGLGWLISNFGSLLDGPSGHSPVVAVDPFGAGKTALPDGRAVAATQGPGAPGGPVLEEGTQIAAVYGTQQPGIAPDGAVPGSSTLTNSGAAAAASGVAPGAVTATGQPVAGESGGPNASRPGGAAGAAAAAAAAAANNDPKRAPDWSQTEPNDKGLPVFSVGPGASGGRNYGSLDEALKQVAGEGAVVSLVGSGPFSLTVPHAVACKRLVITAEQAEHPLIIFGSGGDQRVGSLHLTGGVLELRNVHFLFDRQQLATKEPTKLVTIRDGGLRAVHASWTVAGAGDPAVTALTVEGAPTSAGGARILLDQTVIRGDRVTGLDLRSSLADVVIRDSLLATGDGPVLALNAATSAQAGGGRPPRFFRIFNSTCASRQRIVDLSGEKDVETLPQTQFSWVESVCCTGGGEGAQALLYVDGWKQDKLRATVSWTTTNSVYLGFEELLDFGGASSFKADDASGWQAFWKQKVAADQFERTDWPAHSGAWAAVSPQEFDRDRIPVRSVLGQSGSLPGCPAAKLLVPEPIPPERLAALVHRQPPPLSALQPPEAAITRRVDLKKEDLGQVLSRGDYPAQAVFEITGFGQCAMSPATISKKSVRLIFRQTGKEGVPLKLVPKESKGKDVEALFRVEQGTLELEGARWQGPEPKAESQQPSWFISAVDANVVLRSCELQGPDKAGAPFEGVVRFQTTRTSGEAPYLVCLNSWLCAPGSLIRAEATLGAVYVRNSLLIGRGAAFDLRPRAAEDQLPLLIDVVQSTLVGNRTVFAYQSASLPAAPRHPLRCFVERTVIGPPLKLRAGEAPSPTLLTYAGPALEPRQLDWWGTLNGVSREVAFWIRQEGAPTLAENAGMKAWVDTWGAAHEQRLLSGADGVLLAEALPTRREALKPDAYRLLPSCKAAVWAEGRPIGADLRNVRLGPQFLSEAAPDSKKSATPDSKKSAAPQAGGKKAASPQGGGF